MNEDNFTGVYPVLNVPFNDKYEVDYESLKSLINFLIERDVDGLVMFGLNSEFYKLTDKESNNIIKVLIEENKARKKIIIGVGKPGTEITIKQAKFCEETGADGLMIFPPYCVPIGPKQLFDHYVNVSKSINLPVIIQDSPKYSGVTMDLSFFINLAEACPNIKYAKIENPLSGPKITNIIEGTKGKLKIFAGKGGTHYMEHLKRGVCGIMPGCAVIELFVDIFKKFQLGCLEDAEKIFVEMATLLYLEDQEIEYFIASEKQILKYRGIIRYSVSRKPDAVLEEIARKILFEKLDALIIKYGLK